MITYFTLIITKKALTTIAQMDTPFLPYLLDKFQDSGKFFICQFPHLLSL